MLHSKAQKDPDTALADLSTACLDLRPQELWGPHVWVEFEMQDDGEDGAAERGENHTFLLRAI
jgi:hypothetical protein